MINHIKESFKYIIASLIVIYIGTQVMNDVVYNFYIQQNKKFIALIHFPLRFIKYKGKEIPLNYCKKEEENGC